MKTPTELDPTTGRDDVPAAFPTGVTWLVAVTSPPCLDPQRVSIAQVY
ncbi:MAG: hypothetical protein HN926_03050 [Chloroflexi bacterium]|nr:hypothetical protein [Chloroflexota bacterium]MBT4341063.1 hypothetical protein [Chloroflexota bacterium]MBT4943294.1 hypothetical protein [Chloroflexota bacterium]MBT5252367.1 hypothetical protein [Chloroflexota bacterium]MBT5893204.1 hypothetical protein [Chloroflexota bacterium]